MGCCKGTGLGILRIPVMKPKLATFAEVAPFLQRIDQSNIYSNHGPLVRELEEAYSRYLNVDKELVVAVTNATQAIQGLVSISKNKDWIVPDYTFSATGLAVLNANRQLHICDVAFSDWKIDVSLISAEQESFGIIPVMPFGAPIDFDPYKNFEDVVIDAAASLGSIPPEFSEMPNSWAVVYSLHATKVLGAGEGAIAVCGNLKQAELLRAWSNFGFLSGRTSEIQGTNAKMSEVSGAYGLISIQNIEIERRDWLDAQEFVANQSSDCDWTTIVNSTPQFHPYWIASFKDAGERFLVAQKLQQAGIESREWWAKPLSMQKTFAHSNLLGHISNSKQLSQIHLGLPMYRDLTSNFVAEIIEVVNTGLR
jgi:dTDP-4-amino-4,6-dideoxygalactose transaminase